MVQSIFLNFVDLKRKIEEKSYMKHIFEENVTLKY